MVTRLQRRYVGQLDVMWSIKCAIVMFYTNKCNLAWLWKRFCIRSAFRTTNPMSSVHTLLLKALNSSDCQGCAYRSCDYYMAVQWLYISNRSAGFVVVASDICCPWKYISDFFPAIQILTYKIKHKKNRKSNKGNISMIWIYILWN